MSSSWPPRASDVLVPGCLALLGLVEVVRVEELAQAPLVPLTTTLLMCLTLIVRRTAPLPVAVVSAVIFAAYAVVTLDPGESLVQALCLLVASYAVAVHAPLRPAVGGLAVLLAGGALRGFLMDYDAESLVVNNLWAGIAWGVGRAMCEREARATMAELAADETERLRDEGEREAAEAERRRIARELHDVVAHAVTVIVVQARGARRLLGDEAGEIRGALDAIEETGSDALDELRRMLALLDDPDDGNASGSVRSGPAELAALVERVRAAGLPVELEVNGESAARVASVDVSAYRIVQEALTNALRHGERSPAHVVVTYLPGEIEVRVDAAVSATPAVEAVGSGRGLVGLRERVRLTGGSLEVGVDAGGRFAVHAVLPFEGQST